MERPGWEEEVAERDVSWRAAAKCKARPQQQASQQAESGSSPGALMDDGQSVVRPGPQAL